MGLHDDRNLPTSRANDTFSHNVGLEKFDLEEIEKERIRRANRKPTKRDKIRSDLQDIWMEYLNSNGGLDVFLNGVIDYIIKKDR